MKTTGEDFQLLSWLFLHPSAFILHPFKVVDRLCRMR